MTSLVIEVDQPLAEDQLDERERLIVREARIALVILKLERAELWRICPRAAAQLDVELLRELLGEHVTGEA